MNKNILTRVLSILSQVATEFDWMRYCSKSAEFNRKCSSVAGGQKGGQLSSQKIPRKYPETTLKTTLKSDENNIKYQKFQTLSGKSINKLQMVSAKLTKPIVRIFCVSNILPKHLNNGLFSNILLTRGK